MYGEQSISWSPKICSHELLESSATQQEKSMDASFTSIHIMFGLRVIQKLYQASSECARTCSRYSISTISCCCHRVAFYDLGTTRFHVGFKTPCDRPQSCPLSLNRTRNKNKNNISVTFRISVSEPTMEPTRRARATNILIM